MRLLALALVLALPAAAQGDAAPATVTLSGTVVDAETGDPVMGAGVVIPALGIGAVVQRDGTFAIDDVPAGTHAVRVGAYLYHLVTVEAETGEPLALTLRPGAKAGCEVLHTHGDGGDHAEPVDGDETEG